MRQEAVFDAFYRETRSELLLQALLLTGDLTAAVSALKDGYAIAWQHWRKVGVLEDPLDYVRPLTWRLAQRRHTGRIWHRNPGLTAEQERVLEAMHALSSSARRMVLLVELARLDLVTAGREIGLTYDVAAERLRQGRAHLLEVLGSGDLAQSLRALAPAAAQAKLPRSTVLLRAGRDRRRVTAVASVAGALALTLGAGAAARDPDIDRASALHQLLPGGKQVGERFPDGISAAGPDRLLTAADLSALGATRHWTPDRTDDNTRGDGINVVCQQTRFADPNGLTALVRHFDASGSPRAAELQAVEFSRSVQAAHAAYRTLVGWFAGCEHARLQLTNAYRVKRVGDEAMLLRIRLWGEPMTSYAVGLARVGPVSTMTVTTVAGTELPQTQALANLLSTAVAKLCPDDRPQCAGPPEVAASAPPAFGDEPGFVTAVDLPPVGGIDLPWVGVRSADAREKNTAMTGCDHADFGRAGATVAKSRGYLIPQAEVPDRFGLVETYGEFRSAKAASAFLDGVRRHVRGCEDRDLTAQVSAEYHRSSPGWDLSVWRFESEVSEHETVAFRIGFVRVGTRVAELTFIPGDRDDMGGDAFIALVHRAGERLGELS